jgi:hypothetical protein
MDPVEEVMTCTKPGRPSPSVLIATVIKIGGKKEKKKKRKEKKENNRNKLSHGEYNVFQEYSRALPVEGRLER